MNLEPYEYVINPGYKDYYFYSLGPKGRIKKVVRFTLTVAEGVPYYNLSFGDWNEGLNVIDDFVVSNNADAEKVLMTIAFTVLDFTTFHPAAMIYLVGITPSRTRRYQMGIKKYWGQIEIDFDIFGLIEEKGWEKFRLEANYQAFIVRRK